MPVRELLGGSCGATNLTPGVGEQPAPTADIGAEATASAVGTTSGAAAGGVALSAECTDTYTLDYWDPFTGPDGP